MAEYSKAIRGNWTESTFAKTSGTVIIDNNNNNNKLY